MHKAEPYIPFQAFSACLGLSRMGGEFQTLPPLRQAVPLPFFGGAPLSRAWVVYSEFKI